MTDDLIDAGKDDTGEKHPGKDAPASLIDTVTDPDVDTDPAEEIEERGEPFDGNNA